MECKRILTVLDFSENTGKVLDVAMELADKEKATVCLMHPEPPQSGFAYMTPAGPGFTDFIGFGKQMVIHEDVQSIMLEHDRHALELLKEKVEKKGLNVEIRLLVGDAVSQIVKTAKSFKADLIIMGGHQQGFFADIILGNPEKALIKKTPCPLMVIPEKSE